MYDFFRINEKKLLEARNGDAVCPLFSLLFFFIIQESLNNMYTFAELIEN